MYYFSILRGWRNNGHFREQSILRRFLHSIISSLVLKGMKCQAGTGILSPRTSPSSNLLLPISDSTFLNKLLLINLFPCIHIRNDNISNVLKVKFQWVAPRRYCSCLSMVPFDFLRGLISKNFVLDFWEYFRGICITFIWQLPLKMEEEPFSCPSSLILIGLMNYGNAI